jgi:hypothetical protein
MGGLELVSKRSLENRMAKRIQLRRDISTNWERINPILAQGEVGVDLSVKNFKIGDGAARWEELEYAIVSGKLGRVNADTYIETGADQNNEDTIYFVNNGDVTIEVTPSESKVFINSLFTADIPSINPYTGTIIVTGGAGISGDLNVGGDIHAEDIFVNNATILSKIFGNLEGTVFGNLIGDVYNSTGAKILESGASGVPAVFTGDVNGNINSAGGSFFTSITVQGGAIDGTQIGSTNPANVTGVVVTATDKFVGKLEGDLVGDVYAQNGTTKIIENSSNGTGTTFYGTLVGSTAGDFRGDIYADDSTRKVLENGRGNQPSDANYEPAQFNGNVAGNINSGQVSTFANIEVNGGRIDNAIIGNNIPARIVGTTILATEVFIGQFEGIIVGSSTGDILSANGTKILENGTDGTNAYFVGSIHAKNGTTKILDPGTGGTSGTPGFVAAEYTGNVTGNLTGNVQASAITTSTLSTTGNVSLGADLSVAGDAIITGDISAQNFSLNNNLLAISSTKFTIQTATGDTNIEGDLTVGGDTALNGNLIVTDITADDIQAVTVTTTGNTSVGDDLSVTNDASIGGNVNVVGITTSGSFVGDALEIDNIQIDGNTISSITGHIEVKTATTNDYLDIDSKTLKATYNGVSGTSAFDLTGNVTMSGDLAVNGGDITTTSTIGNLYATTPNINIGTTSTNASTITLGGSATNNTINIKSILAGSVNLSSDVTTGTVNVFNNVTSGQVNIATAGASTINLGGAAATVNVGKNTGDSTLNILGSTAATLSSNTSLVNVFNTNATTLNLAGAATTIEIGAVTGTTSINNNLSVDLDTNILGDLTVGGDLSVQGTLTYLNTTNTEIKDNVILLNKGEIGNGVTAGTAGIEIDRGLTDNSWVKWNESTDTWEFGVNGSYADLKVLDIHVTGNALVDGTLGVTGDVNFVDLYASNITTTAHVNVGGDLQVTGVSQFTGDMTAGNVLVNTNLDVTGNTDLTGTLDVTGLATLANVDINGGNIDATKIGETTPDTIKATDVEVENLVVKDAGEIRFKETAAAGNTYIGLKAPDAFVDSFTLTLPAAKGIDGNVLAFNANGDKLEFVSADLFGGGQVAVSADNGNDLNDGINKPVKTIKRALQIASGIVYDATGKVNGKRLVIAVASGEYYEDNPIIIPDNVSVVGAGLRACNIRPLNNAKDMLRVRNGCYFTEITFRDALDINQKPSYTFNYAVAFDDPTDTFTSRVGYTNLPTTKPTITISPYIQNCSIISFLGANGVLVDGKKVQVPNIPKDPLEAELVTNQLPGIPQQGKSMVANAFTMLSFGGTGWRVTNDAYAQIVSCFQIFCLNGSYCQSGGYLSITNSATNFGQYALRASGYSPNAFEFNRGYVITTSSFLGQDVITAIGFKELPNPHYVTRFRSPSYKAAYDLIQAYKEELAADLIIWINQQITGNISPFLSTFVYNQAKCLRDAKIVLEAVAYDVLSGGNSKIVEAALSYGNANSATLDFQKEENVAAFTRLKVITMPYLTGTGLSTYIEGKFDVFINTLNDPTTAPAVVETTNIGDITSNHILTSPNDIVAFDATSIDIVNNVITIPNHGITNMAPIVYSNNGLNDIPGLDNEQTYYTDLLNANQIRLYTDDNQSKIVDITGLGTGTHAFLKNVREYFIDDVLSHHQVYQKLTLTSSNYTFTPGLDINGTTQTTTTLNNHAYVLSWDPTTRELIVSIDVAAQSPSFLINSIIGGDHSGTPIPGGIALSNVTSLNDYYTATFKVGSTFGSALLEDKISLPGKQIWLHRPSICNSSGHTWEYAGSGIDYNALPQNGGTTKFEYQQVSDLPGRVYSSGTNELGDFLVGDFIKAENKTGNVTFTNTVSIGELDALKLSINDVVIEEFSIDIQLGDSEPGGAKHTRVSTQLAVQSYIKNKLSPFLDREVTTNNIAGAIPQLNSLGLLNPDMIPPIRNFLVWKTNGYGSRLNLKDTVPASNILPADLSTETYSTVEIRIDSTVTADDLTLVTQTATGAEGYLVGNVTNSNVITVASKDVNFDIAFTTAGPITINGTSYTLNTSLGITTIGTVLTNQTSNYVLSEIQPSQFLILDPDETYNFTGISPVTGAITSAQGLINTTDYPPDGLELGVIRQVDNINMIKGSGYTNGVYKNTSLTGGSGTGAKATITVLNNQVTTVEMILGGSGYTDTDLLSATLPLQSGAPGGFSIPVLAIENRLHINNIGGVKFSNNQDPDLKDYVQDLAAPSATITLSGTIEKTFDANAGVNTTIGIDTITIPNHGLINGDPVRYDPVGQVEIGGALQGPQGGNVYYVKYIDADTIQLYTNYTLLAQERVVMYSSGQGTQKLIVSNIDLVKNTIFLANHGYLKGTALKVTKSNDPGDTLPVGFTSGKIYYVGSVTTNSFTLHNDKIDADNSYAGVVTEAKDIQDKGQGSITFTRLNIRVDGAVNTSSKDYANWSGLSANNIAANNIISGIISPSRLGSLAANNTTFLRGDSVYAPVVQNLTKPADSALKFVGSFTNNANNIAEYTNSVSLDIDVVDGSEARATPGGFQYTNLGVARFNRSQFDVGTGTGVGRVTIKDLVVNAGLFNNENAAFYLESSNHSIQPVNKGGTGVSTYTAGDMLYASTNSILDYVHIGNPFDVLQVSAGGDKPEWTNSLTLSGLTVNGDINISGAKSTLNAYDIRMDDNNIELGSVDPVFNREGVVNYTGGGSLTTEVTITLANLGTTGLIPGMTLSKVAVPGQLGQFGNDAKILSVDSATQITVIGTTIPTSGAIRFNAGGATDDTANNGGLTIKSTVNKTFAWKKDSASWTSSENMDLANGKEYKINNVSVLSSNTVLGKELSSQAGKIMTSGSTWVRTFAFMGV